MAEIRVEPHRRNLAWLWILLVLIVVGGLARNSDRTRPFFAGDRASSERYSQRGNGPISARRSRRTHLAGRSSDPTQRHHIRDSRPASAECAAIPATTHSAPTRTTSV